MASFGKLVLLVGLLGAFAGFGDEFAPRRRARSEWPARLREALSLLSGGVTEGTKAPQTLAASPALEKHLPPYRFDVDVSGLPFVWLCTNDGGDGYGGDHTCWVDPVLTDVDGRTVSATTLPVLFWQAGWDRLRRQSLGRTPLTVAGVVYTNGWWIHPNSALCLRLDGRFRRLTVGGGTHASAHAGGKVGFSIEARLPSARAGRVVAACLEAEFPEVDRWLATDLGVADHGHRALFALPAAAFAERTARLLSTNALDRLACADALGFARKTLDFVSRAAPRPAFAARLEALAAEAKTLPDAGAWPSLLARVRALRREIIFSHPLLDFPDLLVDQQPTTRYHHQCDQYLGRHCRPGPGLVILRNWKGTSPRADVLLKGKLPEGSVAHPDLSFDGTRIAFGFCDTTQKDVRRRRFFLWEIGADGTGLRQLTGTPRDPLIGWGGRRTTLIEDFDPCYLPDGGLVFVSTRCQTFGRCHAGRYNPSYLLYRMDADGSNIRQLSFGEANEWDPSVLPDGRIVYTRWDYINRHDTFYQSLWTTHPDGTGTAHLYGNYTINPCMTAEARAIPGSAKLVSTATAHHSYTSGSIILIDPARGEDGPEPIQRFTPEVAFPETEALLGPGAFQTPWPLSEELMFAAYTPDPRDEWGRDNHYGIVLLDALGGREEVFWDPAHSTIAPIPLRPRARPRMLASTLPACASNAPGRVYVQNVNVGREPFGVPIRGVRVNEIIGQPTAHVPHRGAVYQEIVKRVLGTAEVAADGSVAFEMPSGKPVQLQLLDERGMAVMTMRSFIYAQPGETLSCVGCHEPRARAPAESAKTRVTAFPRLRPLKGQEYAGGFSYLRSVQPVLDRHCVTCHGGGEKSAAGLDLRGTLEERPFEDYPYRPRTMRLPRSYVQLVGRPGLVALAPRNRETGISRPRDYFAAAGKLAPRLLGGHCKGLLQDRDGLMLVLTWLDLNAQCFGDYAWSRAEYGETPPPRDGTCGRRPCICGSCWVKEGRAPVEH